MLEQATARNTGALNLDTSRGFASVGFAAFISSFLTTSALPLAVTARDVLVGSASTVFPRRDLFPLPRISTWPAQVDTGMQSDGGLLVLANTCVAALNHLEQGMPKSATTCSRNTCTTAKLSVQLHVCGRVARFCDRLNDMLGENFDYIGAFQKYEKTATGSSYEQLRGDDVDLPKKAATCDPSTLVDPGLWQEVCRGGTVFPENAGGHNHCPLSTLGSARGEYIKLTCRELRCGKLRLRLQACGSAKVFTAPKSTPGHQRKIWDGSLISTWAATPPKPHRLANPSAFLDIRVQPGEALYLSKRDASTFLDVLAVPPVLQPWLGQEPITLAELVQYGGFTAKEVVAFVDDLQQDSELTMALSSDSLLFPVHSVWPMGFSWSSCIAQSTTLGVLKQAGVHSSQILSLEHDLPASQRELCAVATDDTLFFHRSFRHGRRTLQKVDKVFEQHGIPRNRAKDVSLASKMTGLGCDISSRPALVEPAKDKISQAVLGLCDVLERGTSSPAGMSAILGVLQWFCLLQRGMFSIFDKVYGFIVQEPRAVQQPLPASVLDELFTWLAVAPLLPASLERQYLSDLLACDAAPEFGFGVSALSCGPKQVESIGRLSERRGDYVRLLVDDNDEPEQPRLGTAHRLPVKKSAFRTLISKRLRWRRTQACWSVTGSCSR